MSLFSVSFLLLFLATIGHQLIYDDIAITDTTHDMHSKAAMCEKCTLTLHVPYFDLKVSFLKLSCTRSLPIHQQKQPHWKRENVACENQFSWKRACIGYCVHYQRSTKQGMCCLYENYGTNDPHLQYGTLESQGSSWKFVQYIWFS